MELQHPIMSKLWEIRGQTKRKKRKNDEQQADAVDQVFDIYYDVCQPFYSDIAPKAVLLFTGEDIDNGIDFEAEDGYGDNNGNKRGDEYGGGGMGLPFQASAKTMCE